MVIAKASTALAAILFISSVSAQAMEFAERPGPISEMVSSSKAARALPSDDCLRRQLSNLNVLSALATGTKLADRPSPISPRIRFEYGPGPASSWLKPVAATAITFEVRPGPIPNRLTASTARGIKAGDFTSSLTKATILYAIRPGPTSAQFCIGSMAPCGPMRFAERFTVPSRSDSYHHERL
jgi:hypothetical protein